MIFFLFNVSVCYQYRGKSRNGVSRPSGNDRPPLTRQVNGVLKNGGNTNGNKKEFAKVSHRS